VAASFLSAAQRKLVAIDDTFDNARATGLHLITAQDEVTGDEITGTAQQEAARAQVGADPSSESELATAGARR
jgi:hypothetical protein